MRMPLEGYVERFTRGVIRDAVIRVCREVIGVIIRSAIHRACRHKSFEWSIERPLEGPVQKSLEWS